MQPFGKEVTFKGAVKDSGIFLKLLSLAFPVAPGQSSRFGLLRYLAGYATWYSMLDIW